MIRSPHATRRLLTTSALVCTIGAVLVTQGCAASKTQPEIVGQSPSPPASANASASPQTSTVPLSSVKVSLQKVAGGFNQPLYVASPPDGSGRLFVLEKTGKIKVVRNGTVQPTPYLDISNQITTDSERGLLGLAFAPDFATSGKFYLDYTDLSGNTVIARYVAADPASDTPNLTGPQKLLGIKQPFPNHKGGCIQFAPDGMLWIGMGDGGSEGDPGGRGQNPHVLLGKMLRIDVSRTSGTKPYAVPPDNPGGRFLPEIWATGLRNPWRFSFDKATGMVWIGDVGQNNWEEIDVQPITSGGLNYGWNWYEGTHPYPPGSTPKPKTGLTFPLIEYPHPLGEAVIGGYVYRGTAFPKLEGTYLYADFIKGEIWGYRPKTASGPAQQTLFMNTGMSPSSFGLGQDGELYLTDFTGGGLFHITAP